MTSVVDLDEYKWRKDGCPGFALISEECPKTGKAEIVGLKTDSDLEVNVCGDKVTMIAHTTVGKIRYDITQRELEQIVLLTSYWPDIHELTKPNIEGDE